MAHYLEFEKEIKIIEDKLEEVKKFQEEKHLDLTAEIEKLESKLDETVKNIYGNLTPWQKNLVARHPARPYTLDYVKLICDDFVELHGDRLFGEDPAIVGGVARINNQPVMIIGSQRGRDINENLHRNFGYANPEGYRKALRLMKMADRFKMPVVTFIDTAGAYPGLEAEERGQAEAIARNLLEMAGLTVPIVAVITGEGGSGGALALGVGNKVLMLENSVYSTISPEGCAAILYKDSSKAKEAAENLRIDANSLYEMKIVDDIIKEPVGGAHRDHNLAAEYIKERLVYEIGQLKKMSPEELREQRYQKFRQYGEFIE